MKTVFPGIVFFLVTLSIFLPGILSAQRFLSLENTQRFKRIRIEIAQHAKFRMKGPIKSFSGEITAISGDTLYFGSFPVPVDSITKVHLPPGKNFKYWITLLSTGIPGVFFLTIVSIANVISSLPADPKMAIQPALIATAGLAMLYAVYKMSFRSKKIGKHWKLRVLDLQLAP